MSEIAHYFAPLNFEEISENQNFTETQFGNDFLIYKQGSDFPEIEGFDMAIIGVCEERNAHNNEGCALAPDVIRSFLYKLYGGNFRAKVVDLGNINAGHDV